jgi:hypothetical protein
VAISVTCLTSHLSRYKKVAEAMHAGILACGDRSVIRSIYDDKLHTHVGVCYGWKHNAAIRRYPNFVYADLGYWGREQYYRFAVNGWSPQVRTDLSADRFNRLGLEIRPWRTEGRQIIVAGSTEKACRDHGLGYMQWETAMCHRLAGLGIPVVYRPKPNDRQARPIPGFGFDQRPIGDALQAAHLWVTHHSNSALDALVAGVPVHCETGAASQFSAPLSADPPLLEGREQFLTGVAWLQWTLDEMRSGECWAHLRTYIC